MGRSPKQVKKRAQVKVRSQQREGGWADKGSMSEHDRKKTGGSMRTKSCRTWDIESRSVTNTEPLKFDLFL